jgi:hypothetical protein
MSSERSESAVEPQPDDSADVRWALETALAMWQRGDREQTLRWLGTAVQTASNEGQHDRAYALGRALSELERGPLPSRRPRPPVSVPAGPASTTQPLSREALAASAKASRPKKSLLQSTPYRIVPDGGAPDEVTSHFAPDPSLLEACQASEQEATAPEAAAADSMPMPEVLKVARERPRPPAVVNDALDATLTNVRPAPPASRDAAERTVVMTAEELMAPSVRSQSAPSTVGSPQATLEPMRALRVAVVSGQGREFVLRLLADDEVPPAGHQEALLIALGRPAR